MRHQRDSNETPARRQRDSNETKENKGNKGKKGNNNPLSLELDFVSEEFKTTGRTTVKNTVVDTGEVTAPKGVDNGANPPADSTDYIYKTKTETKLKNSLYLSMTFRLSKNVF